jgi:hypothetical protein
MKGAVDAHGIKFRWEFMAARGQAGYKLRVFFSELRGEREYPVGMSRPRVEKEAKRLAEQVCVDTRLVRPDGA